MQNLVGVSLEVLAASRQDVRRLLDAAVRHIADAKVKAVSAETRFGSAYTAIRMLGAIGGTRARSTSENRCHAKS